MILRALIHIFAILVIAALTAWPALYAAVIFTETGVLGECREGGCAYTALFLVFPIFWIVSVGVVTALWLRVYRKSVRPLLD